jgi:hypothetical protein
MRIGCQQMLTKSHEGIAEEHYIGKDTTEKVLCTRLWWPTVLRDAKENFQQCDVC